jgi:ubiquinone/menaquinone biosynthesis C-methylase UbiE
MMNDYDKFAKERQEELKKGIKKPHRFIEKPMMRELLPDLTGKKVLMLGCGTGEESIMLKEFGALNIIGIDLSEESIRLAKESYPDCEFIVGDMHNLPFDDESFDFIYSSLAIHYSGTPEEVYKEIYRVLKHDGELLFSVGHPLRWACEEIEVDGVKCRGIGHGVDGNSDKVFGNYNTFKKHDHYFNNGEVLSFYVGSPSFIFKILKKVGFIVEDFTEAICTDECKDYDMCYWNKFHEIPNFMAFLARK